MTVFVHRILIHGQLVKIKIYIVKHDLLSERRGRERERVNQEKVKKFILPPHTCGLPSVARERKDLEISASAAQGTIINIVHIIKLRVASDR